MTTEYAQVKKMLGGAWVEAFCFDGKERRCHIPGSFRKKVIASFCRLGKILDHEIL